MENTQPSLLVFAHGHNQLHMCTSIHLKLTNCAFFRDVEGREGKHVVEKNISNDMLTGLIKINDTLFTLEGKQ